MRLEWLEDLIALAEADSLTEAALRRHVTQPAFSRRVQGIESRLGFELLDRRRRPARATEALHGKLPELRETAAWLRRLEQQLASESQPNRVVIAAQQSLTVSLLPRALTGIRQRISAASIRLHPANLDECHSLLMTRQASIMASYDTPEFPAAPNEVLLERRTLRAERLIPVAAPGLFAASGPGEGEALPLIAYPPEARLGAIVAARCLPALQARFRLRVACETSLTAAQLELALCGWGLAWLPEALTLAAKSRGELVDLSEFLGEVPMRVAIFRLQSPPTAQEDAVWQALTAALSDNT